MSFEGGTMLTDFILADLHLDGMQGAPAGNIYWHAEGILAVFPLGGTRYRVIADVGESASKAIGEHRVPTLEEVQRILDVRGPKGWWQAIQYGCRASPLMSERLRITGRNACFSRAMRRTCTARPEARA